MFGTPGASTYWNLGLAPGTAAATAAPGDVWTLSVYAAIANSSGAGALSLSIGESDSGGGYLIGGASVISLSAAQKTVSHTRTLTSPSVSRVYAEIYFPVTGGVPVDITFIISATQLVKGLAYPTSPIFPPAGTIATSSRVADGYIQLPATALPPNQAEMTIVLDGVFSPTHNTDPVTKIASPASAQHIFTKANAVPDIFFTNGTNYSSVAPTGGATSWNGKKFRIALMNTGGNSFVAISVDGASTITGNAIARVTYADQIRIGETTSGSRFALRCRVFDRELSHAEFEALP